MHQGQYFTLIKTAIVRIGKRLIHRVRVSVVMDNVLVDFIEVPALSGCQAWFAVFHRSHPTTYSTCRAPTRVSLTAAWRANVSTTAPTTTQATTTHAAARVRRERRLR